MKPAQPQVAFPSPVIANTRRKCVTTLLKTGLLFSLTSLPVMAAAGEQAKLVFAYEDGKRVDAWIADTNGHFAANRITTTVNNSTLTIFGTDILQATLLTDTNNDGINDVIYADEPSGKVSVWLGKPDYTFDSNPVVTQVAPTAFRFGMYVLQQTLPGDVNGDGNVDLVFAYETGKKLYVWPGTGDGHFASYPVTTAVSGGPLIGTFGADILQQTLLGDVNGDGYADVVFAYKPTASLYTWLGRSNGTFTTAPVTTRVTAVSGGFGTDILQDTFLRDVNGDGMADVVFTYEATKRISVWSGKASGGFDTTPIPTDVADQPFIFGTDILQKTLLGDVTGDGNPDVVFAYEPTMSRLPGNSHRPAYNAL